MCWMPGVTWKPKSLPQSDSEINLYAALFVVSCWEGWGLWCYILYFISQLHNLTVSIICKFQSLEAFQSTKPGLKTNFYSSVNLNMNVIRRLSKDHNGWMPWRSISFYTFIYGIVLANFVRIKIKQCMTLSSAMSMFSFCFRVPANRNWKRAFTKTFLILIILVMLLPGNNSKCRFNVVIIFKQQGMSIIIQN